MWVWLERNMIPKIPVIRRMAQIAAPYGQGISHLLGNSMEKAFSANPAIAPVMIRMLVINKLFFPFMVVLPVSDLILA